MMEVYLDNAATTRVFPEVRDIMIKTMEEDFGNPSSMHRKGVSAENYIRDAKEIIAKELKVQGKEIVFTSGGTESNNLALVGAALANQRAGKHIITTGIEHASVYNPLLALQDLGFEITFLGVDETGVFSLEELRDAIREDTILVSTMFVNNEIGSIQPVLKAAEIIKEKNEKTLYHVDAIQGFGKFHIYPKKWGIDLLSVSGHKIHGPKGSGFLYIRDKAKVKPQILGGGQQKDMRSGTENVPAIAGLGKAVQIMYGNLEERMTYIADLKKKFQAQVSQIENIRDNSGEAPHIASISFPGVRSEVLLHALEDKGIYVSAGSACSSNHPAISGVLKAIHLEQDKLESTLRFSFSSMNTPEEIDYVTDTLKELVPVLRRFTRR